MSNFHRKLIALEMLSQDLVDESMVGGGPSNQSVSQRYTSLLKQYLDTACQLAELATAFTQKGFAEAIASQSHNLHLVNKKMLLIENKLVDYVLKFYDAARRIEALRDKDFSDNAEVRFDLLTTRAIKYKSQYRTVATALSRQDYQRFIQSIGLPEADWGWKTLHSG